LLGAVEEAFVDLVEKAEIVSVIFFLVKRDEFRWAGNAF